MKLPCGCDAVWLTQISVPIGADAVTDEPCPCCHAPAGQRCEGASAGPLPERPRTGWDKPGNPWYCYACPARVQAARNIAGVMTLS